MSRSVSQGISAEAFKIRWGDVTIGKPRWAMAFTVSVMDPT